MSNNIPVFDWSYFNNFIDDDSDLAKQMLTMFIENLSHDLKAMQNAYINKNNQEWKECAHRTKGVCANIGARQLQELCRQAETCDHPDDIQEQIEQSFIVLEIEIKNYLLSQKAK